MSFIFYDTETTGIDTSFDQILQFAAIRTDYELNETDRFTIRSRLLPHIVPSPVAIRVNGISVQQLTDPSLPSHYEMVRAIQAKMLEWSPAIFVGFNSLRFDEILLRQALYQTLHPPYLTNTNGNCRSDAMRMVQATTLFSPNALSIPLDQGGRQVFRLDRLAPANGFDHGGAHEAMTDVEATIDICRLINERAPDLWSVFMRFAQKAAVSEYVMSENIFSLSDFYSPGPCSWLVTAIGTNPENSSEIYVFDLAVDPDELATMSDSDLVARLGSRPKPVRVLRSNASPILMPQEEAPDIASATSLDNMELERRAQVLRDDKTLRDRLIAAFQCTRQPREPSEHVERQIYDGFYSTSEQIRLDEFHTTNWENRSSLINQLEDERLRHLGRRLIQLERPDLFEESTRQEFDVALARRIMGEHEDVQWLTLPKAIREVDDLIAQSEGEAESLLREFRGYLVERSEQAMELTS